MKLLRYALVLSAVVLILAGCQSNPSQPLSQMDKGQVEQKILGKVHESCLRSRLESSSTQDFSEPGIYKVSIHKGFNAGTYTGQAIVEETGVVRISGYNGPYGATEFEMVFRTDGKNIYMDRTPPHPAGKNYLWVNCP